MRGDCGTSDIDKIWRLARLAAASRSFGRPVSALRRQRAPRSAVRHSQSQANTFFVVMAMAFVVMVRGITPSDENVELSTLELLGDLGNSKEVHSERPISQMQRWATLQEIDGRTKSQFVTNAIPDQWPDDVDVQEREYRHADKPWQTVVPRAHAESDTQHGQRDTEIARVKPLYRYRDGCGRPTATSGAIRRHDSLSG